MGSAMLQTPAIDIEAHILIEISSDRATKVRLCRFNNSQPDGRVSDHWAEPLSLAEGSGDRREPVPEAAIPS